MGLSGPRDDGFPVLFLPGGLRWFRLVCRALLTHLYSILGALVGNIIGSWALAHASLLGGFRNPSELVHAPGRLLILVLL